MRAVFLLPGWAIAVHVAVAVSRLVSMRRRWQVDDLPVAYPSFGNDVIGKFLHIFTGSLQDGHLHAAFVV